MKLKILKTKTTLTLKNTLNANKAEELYQLLRDAVKAGNPITIQSENIAYIDSLCCQVLASAALSCAEKKLPFTFVSPEEILQKNMHTLGLQNILHEGTAA